MLEIRLNVTKIISFPAFQPILSRDFRFNTFFNFFYRFFSLLYILIIKFTVIFASKIFFAYGKFGEMLY